MTWLVFALIGDILWFLGSAIFWSSILNIEPFRRLAPWIGFVTGLVGFIMSVVSRLWVFNTHYLSYKISTWMDVLPIAILGIAILAVALHRSVSKHRILEKIYEVGTDSCLFLPFVAFLIGIAFRIAKMYLPFFQSL